VALHGAGKVPGVELLAGEKCLTEGLEEGVCGALLEPQSLRKVEAMPDRKDWEAPTRFWRRLILGP